MRTRLCIHASPASCRIPASTNGNPVRPAVQAASRSRPGDVVASSQRRAPTRVSNGSRTDCGACHRTSA